ncbi:MAG: 16S rRNA (cytidine(1402)-2'-O)-methyltransferase [Mariprofundales bacterium]
MAGTLYIVATPIGNLADITLRALEVLKAVAWIAAEDTRTSRKLLAHYQIDTQLLACHEHNEQAVAVALLNRLQQGEDGALISDAGTPLVCDPGYRLIQTCIAAGITVVPIPGASSILTALCASGLPPIPFSFLGFLPRSGSGRGRRLREIGDSKVTVVVLESPRRVKATLEEMRNLGHGQHRVVMARELTKLYESFIRGTVESLLKQVEETPPRGEVVLLFSPPEEMEPSDSQVEDAAILMLLNTLEMQEKSPSHRAKAVAQQLGVSKQRVYDLLHD